MRMIIFGFTNMREKERNNWNRGAKIANEKRGMLRNRVMMMHLGKSCRF